MDPNQIALNIIANAGDSQSYSMQAIKCIHESDYEEALKCIEQAKEASLKSHKAHTELMTLGARDESVNINLLIVHASNHFSVAEVMITMTELFFETTKEMREKC